MVILATSAVLAAVQFSLAIPLDAPGVIPRQTTPSLLNHGFIETPFYLPSRPTAVTSVSSPVAAQADQQHATRTLPILAPPSTITITYPPSTITRYITLPESTVTLPKTSSTPSIPLTLPPTQSLNSSDTKTTWSIPPHMTDLSSFNVLSFPNGQSNLKILADLPPSAHRSSPPISTTPSSSTILQLKYPAHSISPSRFPQGGAQFYACPIALTTARNVSFQYSAFFPPDFDWVLGGKLPGLYGGHTGCSGGSDANDCFSTRLMWRKGGVGELYLYAPKTRQSPALCSSPGSVCNFDYGFSIGRGSFTWALGAWTTVIQTVVLNTPGLADGWFLLDVGGRRVIERRDVFYREEVPRRSVKPTQTGVGTQTRVHVGTGTVSQAKTTETSSGGLLGGILGPLLGSNDEGSLLIRDVNRPQRLFSANVGNHDSTRTRELLGIAVDTPLFSSGDEGTLISVDVGLGELDNARSSGSQQPVGFTGIFFSTFFGGHDERYETPKDQYVWFRDFALAINA